MVKSIHIWATNACRRMMVNCQIMRASPPPRRSMIPKIMIFLTILSIDQAIKSHHKKFQRVFKMKSKPASQLSKILSLIPCTKMLFHTQEWNCNHIPAHNWKSLTYLKLYPLPITLLTEKDHLHLTWHWSWRIILWVSSDVSWNLPDRVGSRREKK